MLHHTIRTWVAANRWGLAFLLVTWLVFFSRILSGTSVYFLDDLKIIYYPLEVVYAQFQLAGDLPEWSPLFGFGQPLLAWGQLGFFIPLHVILRALAVPALTLLQISVITYFAIGLLGFYCFLRRQNISPEASALGAIVFVFSGFNIGHLNHVNFYTATMLVPWLLLASDLFIRQPTLARAALVAVTGALLPLSGQPQVSLYCYVLVLIISAGLVIRTYGIRAARQRAQLARLAGLSIVAALLAFCLASLSILPLLEFLPITERSADLPIAQLFEFSYPPSHVITLLFPYFFGDHSSYWGAKGFQELAAYIGIIPLILGATAFVGAPRHRSLRWTALALIVLGTIGALGQYSPPYRWLVENHFLTSLNIPGRFVFFVTSGTALVAALGLDRLAAKLTTGQRFRAVVILVLLLAMLTVPVYVTSQHNSTYAAALQNLINNQPASAALVAGGLAAGLLALGLSQRLASAWPARLLTTLTALTLIAYGWNYNPLTPRARLAEAGFQDVLARSAVSSVPPRLYSREQLLTDEFHTKNIPTPFIGPEASLYQPLSAIDTRSPCLLLPLYTSTADGSINIGLHREVDTLPIETHTISAQSILQSSVQRLCFQTLVEQPGEPFLLSLTSSKPSTVNAYYTRLETASIYIVRVSEPTPEQLVESQKPGRLTFETDAAPTIEPDLFLLPRHLQAAVGSSSARWIGALSIQPYRDFIETFFANDREPMDGDNQHVLAKHRDLFNMAGVTHFIQALPPGATDRMTDHGFQLLAEENVDGQSFRLYQNPDAWSKVFLVPNATFSPAADEIRAHLLTDAPPLNQHIYVSGPVPPDTAHLNNPPLTPTSRATIARYQPTEISIDVTTPTPAWLVLTDSTTPQWHTYVDDAPAPRYIAHSLFKAAYVPAGSHTINFRYESAATSRAKTLTIIGLAGTILSCMPYRLLKRPH